MKKLIMIFLAVFVSTVVFSQTRCNSCSGYGKFRCNVCGGGGVVYQQVYNPYYGLYQTVPYACANCGGYGAIVCRTCGGYGYVSTPSFRGNGDGYVYQGIINLKRTISGTYDRFPLYNYRGTNYVKVGSSYINISGTGTVNINNIKYNKP